MSKQDSQSATDYQRLFEATPAPHLVLDLDFHIIAANDAYLDATLTEREAIVGRHIFDVFPDNPEDPNATGVANLSASLETVRQSKQPHSMDTQRYDLRRADGTFEERYWQPTNTPVFDDQGNLFQIIHQPDDVTDMVRLERRGASLEKLHRNTLRDLFMNAPAMVVVLREPGHIIEMVNNPARQWLGDFEMEGLPAAEAIPNLGQTDRLAQLDEVYRTGEPLAVHQSTSPLGPSTSDPERDYVSYVLHPLHGEHGEVDKIVVFGFDVTEYVQARRQVETLAIRAQEESRNKDQFLAMLGHELRNPMAAISTAVYVLKSAAAEDLSSDRLNWGLDIIDRQLEQLTRLVNDLLDVARINEGRIDLQQEEVSVNEISSAASRRSDR